MASNSHRNPKRPLTHYHPHFTDVETEGERRHLPRVRQALQRVASLEKLEDSAIERQASSLWVLPPAGF